MGEPLADDGVELLYSNSYNPTKCIPLTLLPRNFFFVGKAVASLRIFDDDARGVLLS